MRHTARFGALGVVATTGLVTTALVTMALVTGALAACGLVDDRPVAGVVGDSITLQVVEEVRQQSDDDWRLDIRPMPGATIGEMLEDLDGVARRNPEQVIVNLGTNNVLRAVPPAASAAELEAMFATRGDVPCVHVVTVHDYIFSWEEGYLTDRSVAFNELLVDAAARHGAEVIDWTAVVTEARQAPEAPEVFTDTVHLAPAGIELLAEVYDRALADGCG
jgi:hypothetical protein